MNPRRWRLAALFSGLVLALQLFAASGTVVNAAGPGQLISTSYGWLDPVCNTSNPPFEVRLFQDINYGGTQYRICSAYSNFCWMPYGNDSSAALLCSGGCDCGTLNDLASSIKVIAVNGAASCAVHLYEDAGYSPGTGWVAYDPVNVPSLVPWPNDLWSSIRRIC